MTLSSNPPLLRTVSAEQAILSRTPSLHPDALETARTIIDDVSRRGTIAVRAHAERLGDLKPGEPLLLDPDDLRKQAAALPSHDLDLLRRVADRVRSFAQAQLTCLLPLEVPIPGGVAGHRVLPIARAGCYAPGGRFPLPSSALMTAVTARTAGVQTVVVASPRPTTATIAAAWVSGADALLTVGGAHAIAAIALGIDGLLPTDIIVGPGNRFVTAAKFLLSGRVGIDALAGPSELLIIADNDADPALIAADLLAQAEHDPDAIPVLLTNSASLIQRVNTELVQQLSNLPTAATARAALANGFAALLNTIDDAPPIADRIGPEHLQVMTRSPQALADRLRCYGSLFIGARSAEVLGDYGAGPNHVLPTGGTARHSAGLSVLNFLRARTFLRIDDPRDAAPLAADAARLARIEGLEAHARAAEARLP